MKNRFKDIKNKKTIIALGVGLLAIIGITLAYFGTTDSFPNVFHTQKYSSKSKEEFNSPTDWAPGDTTAKSLIVTNTGNICENVRVYTTENWTSKNGDTLPNNPYGMQLAIINTTNYQDWVKDGDYYYYNKDLQPNDSTTSFINSVTYNKLVENDYECVDDGNGQRTCSTSGDGYDGATYKLTIHIETIQCDLAEETWNVDVTELESYHAMFAGGEIVNNAMKTLAGNGSTGIDDWDTNITAFRRSSEIPANITIGVDTIDVTEATYTDFSNTPIYLWYDNGVIYWYSEAENVYLNFNISCMFRRLGNLTDISGLENLNTSWTTYSGPYLFEGDYSLSDITALSSWDTTKFNYLVGTFSGCASLTDITPLSGWNTSKVTSISNIFYGCNDLNNITPLARWDVSKVQEMDWSFYLCNLTSLKALSNWQISSMESLSGAFSDNYQLTDISVLSNWSTSKVTKMNNLFKGCNELNNISSIANWDVSKVETIAWLFQGTAISDLTPLSNWNTTSVTSFESTFRAMNNLTSLDGLEDWDTSNVTTFLHAFHGDQSLNDLSALSGWDVSSVQSFVSAFDSCTSLTNLNGLNSWNVSGDRDLRFMFTGCAGLTDASAINGWDVRNIKYTSNSKDDNYFWQMFHNCNVHPTFANRAGTWTSAGTFVPSA